MVQMDGLWDQHSVYSVCCGGDHARKHLHLASLFPESDVHDFSAPSCSFSLQCFKILEWQKLKGLLAQLSILQMIMWALRSNFLKVTLSSEVGLRTKSRWSNVSCWALNPSSSSYFNPGSICSELEWTQVLGARVTPNFISTLSQKCKGVLQTKMGKKMSCGERNVFCIMFHLDHVQN